jgi:ATP-dependent 26S proteasome regulatory subunit
MILFILTTNAPEHLEAALASRPGRIDQAIEFPLPDDDGRRKLIHLYARGMKVADEVVNQLVRKTKNASPAFIKELMRRSAQYCIQDGDGQHLAIEQVEGALDEMFFSGGSLNVKVLGGALQIGSAEAEG